MSFWILTRNYFKLANLIKKTKNLNIHVCIKIFLGFSDVIKGKKIASEKRHQMHMCTSIYTIMYQNELYLNIWTFLINDHMLESKGHLNKIMFCVPVLDFIYLICTESMFWGKFYIVHNSHATDIIWTYESWIAGFWLVEQKSVLGWCRSTKDRSGSGGREIQKGAV